MKKYSFKATLHKQPNNNATFIEFPFNVETEFGVRGQVKVHALFDGVAYRGSLAKMGHHCHILGVTREIREQLGKPPGDLIEVVLWKDEQPRVVEIPEYFSDVLASEPDLAAYFKTLSYTHQKEYVVWITSAKKEDTRQRRMEKALDMLRQKRRNPK
jgi:hypothetical protein